MCCTTLFQENYLRMLIFSKIFISLFVFIFSFSAHANDIIEDNTLTIGVYISPPYVIKDTSGNYSGYAIDILSKSLHSARINKKINYKEYASVPLMLADIDNLDIAVSSISFTPDRLKLMEFSQPFDEGGLGVMVNAKDNVVSNYTFIIYVYIAVGLLTAGLLLTLFDRYYIPGFTRDWWSGYSESMFHVVSVILRGNSSHPPVFNKALQYWFSILWMFSGSAFMSFVMVTYMGLMKHDPEITSKEKLFESRIAVQAGTSAEFYIKDKGSIYLKYNNLSDAVDLLLQGHIDAIVGDKAVLSYYEHIKKGLPIAVLDKLPLNKELYGYAFPLNSPLRIIIDKNILEYYTNGKIDGIKNYYGVTE